MHFFRYFRNSIEGSTPRVWDCILCGLPIVVVNGQVSAPGYAVGE